jgi:hypothetical protein
VADEARIDLPKMGLPRDIEKLRKVTKSEIVKETPELVNLCKALLSSESETINRFALWIRYFRENRYNSDINQLIDG